MYRVKKQRKKYETSYDFLFLEPDVRDHIKKVNNYFFNIPQLYANTITIDSILVEVVCNKNRLCVRAKEDISKGTIITQFTGWMVNFTPLGDDRDHDIVKINEKKYEGIRYPRMLCGVGSLIRKAEKKEVPNITFVQHENRIIWAKSSIKIFKGEELIRPNK